MTIGALGTLVSSHTLRNIISSKAVPKLQVLDVSWVRLKPGVGYQQFYLKQHIPGSMYFDLNQCSTPTQLVPFPLPDTKCLTEYIGTLGIDKDTHVITYDQEDSRSALRAWWLLRYIGHSNVSLLDGGLRNWVASGFDVTEKPSVSAKCKFECVPDPSLLRDYAAVQRNLETKEEQIVDSRPSRSFEEGRIPDSQNIPYSQLFTEDGTFKSEEELQELFDNAGIDLSKPLISSCQLGVTACGVAAAAHLLGNTNTGVYLGSWNEWSQRAPPEHISEG